MGGFAGSPSAALLTSWLMLAAFQPIDRDHAAKGTRDHEPWVDGPEQEAIRRRFIEERYRLMPYLYTTAEEMSRTGLPIVRPLFLEFPHSTSDGHPFDLGAEGEFLFGPSLLVAPPPTPEEVAPYEIHLPAGIWYDYWTGERLDRRPAAGSSDLEIRDKGPDAQKPILSTPSPGELPVYVRGGTILPMESLTQSTGEKPAGPLTLRIYPGDDCRGDLYLDDGTIYDFRKGAYFRQHFSCATETDGSVSVTLGKVEGSFTPWWKEVRVELVALQPVGKPVARLGSKQLPVDKTTLGWATVIPFATASQTVVFVNGRRDDRHAAKAKELSANTEHELRLSRHQFEFGW